tara:strand:- start:89 stop:2014 length:1926 start_codon:yes stop_codon:yes gene_type:complete
MSFQTDIEAITGSISSYTTEANSYLVEGVKFITKYVMNNMDIEPRLTQSSSKDNSTPTHSMTDVLKVCSVTRNDGTRNRECSEINSADRDNYADINSIYYTSKFDPVYYILDNTLNILPTPTASETASVVHITPDDSVSVSESTISNFPTELNRGVVLYASQQVLRKFLNEKNATLVALSTGLSGISAPTGSGILTEVTYSGPGNDDVGTASAASVTNSEAVSASDAISLGSPPAYNKLENYNLTGFDPSSTISALSFSGISAPSLTGINQVTYSGPGNDDVGTIGEVTTGFGTTVSAVGAANIGSAPSYSESSSDIDYTTATIGVDALITSEDVELANAALTKAQQQLQDYQADIQNKTGTFNSNVEKFRADNQALIDKVQRDLQASIANAQNDLAEAQNDAQLSQDRQARNAAEKSQRLIQNSIQTMQAISADNETKIAEFNANLNKYQALINTQVTEHQTNVQREIQKAELLRTTELSSFSAQIQDELNEFNGQNSNYQVEIQSKLDKVQRDLQANIADAQNDLAAAQATAQLTTDVNVRNHAEKSQRLIQNAIQTMQSTMADNEANLAKYNADIGKYQADVNKAIQDYTLSLQEVTQDYNWLKDQYAIVSGDLVQFLQPYLPPREVQREVATNDRPS